MQVDDPEQIVFEETPIVHNTPPPPEKYNPCPRFHSPIIISQEALNMFKMGVRDDRIIQSAHYTPRKYTPASTANPIDI